jgi:hypothetical protein
MGLMKALKYAAKVRNNRFHASVKAIISWPDSGHIDLDMFMGL